MSSDWLHYMSKNLLETIAVFIFLLLIHSICYFLLKRKTTDNRKKYRYRIRLSYLMTILFLISLAQIWLGGFEHLLAVLGLVAAAIIVANKESIMNITGFLVINWRELFAEGDLIRIQEIQGYVHTIGVFYFTIYESVDSHIKGSVARIPNGLAITQPILNYSSIENLSLQKVDITLSINSDLPLALQQLTASVNKYIEENYADRKEFTLAYLKRHQRKLFRHDLSLIPKATLSISQGKCEEVILSASFFCFLNDIKDAKTAILVDFLTKIKKHQLSN